MRSQDVATVDTWHHLLNSGDIERLVTLIHHGIELGGPRSVSSSPKSMSSGVQVFREWFGRAEIQLTPLRYFHKGNVVVAEEEGVWHSPDDGRETGRQMVSSLFTLDICIKGDRHRCPRRRAKADPRPHSGARGASQAPPPMIAAHPSR